MKKIKQKSNKKNVQIITSPGVPIPMEGIWPHFGFTASILISDYYQQNHSDEQLLFYCILGLKMSQGCLFAIQSLSSGVHPGDHVLCIDHRLRN